MTLIPVTFRHHHDTEPDAVQALLHTQYAHVARLAHDREAELSPDGLRILRRCAFSLWYDARTPVRTTPIAEVVG